MPAIDSDIPKTDPNAARMVPHSKKHRRCTIILFCDLRFARLRFPAR
jgi:hypothetical protein